MDIPLPTRGKTVPTPHREPARDLRHRSQGINPLFKSRIDFHKKTAL